MPSASWGKELGWSWLNVCLRSTVPQLTLPFRQSPAGTVDSTHSTTTETTNGYRKPPSQARGCLQTHLLDGSLWLHVGSVACRPDGVLGKDIFPCIPMVSAFLWNRSMDNVPSEAARVFEPVTCRWTVA